jgi:uncharacterized membrane protein YhiD involved in acid resistance
MLEFLITQNSSENPSFMGILLAVLSSFFLSFLIVITYKITTPRIHQSNNFTQSLALISIVAATVMQAIGDSLARGLGMLGALAIIRFRTRLDNPRNMTFMFASIAVGISCGVFGFTIAFVGTIIFCIAALLVHFSGMSQGSSLTGNIRVSLPIDKMDMQKIEEILSVHCRHFTLDQFRTNTDTFQTTEVQDPGQSLVKIQDVTYQFALKARKKPEILLGDLRMLDGLMDVRLRINSSTTESV